MRDNPEEFERLELDPVKVTWGEEQLAGRTLRPNFFVEPMTIITIVTAIIEKFNAMRAAQAEKDFRDSVLRELEQIQEQIATLRQELANLGVLILAEIRSVPVAVASAELKAELRTVRSFYSELEHNRQRAVEEYVVLHRLTSTAAEYGPALIPEIAVAFTALLSLLHLCGGAGSRLGRSLKPAWIDAFREMMNPNKQGSLPYQEAVLNRLIEQATQHLDAVPIGRFHVGTHNYGRTDIFLNVTRGDENTFSVWLEPVDKPSPPRHEGIGGDAAAEASSASADPSQWSRSRSRTSTFSVWARCPCSRRPLSAAR